MTVYIVEFKSHVCYDLAVDAVFSTLEKADAHAKSLAAEGTCVIQEYEVQ